MATMSLDRHLCFALYSASRAMTAAYRPILTELNLTYPQYLVLLVLWEEGRITVGGLGERLQLDSGTLSPLLKRLEANGFVRRERSSDDERLVDVTLTPEGRRRGFGCGIAGFARPDRQRRVRPCCGARGHPAQHGPRRRATVGREGTPGVPLLERHPRQHRRQARRHRRLSPLETAGRSCF